MGYVFLSQDINYSLPLHFYPNAALEVTLLIIKNKFLLRLTGSPLDEEMVSIRFHTASFLVNLKKLDACLGNLTSTIFSYISDPCFSHSLQSFPFFF